jgi:hypothetical protein
MDPIRIESSSSASAWLELSTSGNGAVIAKVQLDGDRPLVFEPVAQQE